MAQDSGTPTPAPRPSKAVVSPPPEVVSKPFFTSVQINGAIAGIACAVIEVCHAFHIPLPFSESELVVGLGGIATIVVLLYWIWKRITLGNDPSSTLAPLTLK